MSLQAIVLAAGSGTRMKAVGTNKCLSLLSGKPLIRYPLEALGILGIQKPIVVVGFAHESIERELKDEVTYALQEEPNGTAKALEVGVLQLDPDVEEVIVLYGDHSAFYDAPVLQSLIDTHHATGADMTLVTVVMDDPRGYGRIVRTKQGNVSEIVEEKNASDQEKKIKEINSGNGIYSVSFLRKFLPQITANNVTNEYYLTDIVKMGIDAGYIIETMVSHDPGLSMGVNTPEQLQAAQEYMKEKKLK